MSSEHQSIRYHRTPEGEQELAQPKHGLSINQRKLLQLVDGQNDVTHLLARLAGSADEQQLTRDLDRLDKLGLLTGGQRGAAGAAQAHPHPIGRPRSRVLPVTIAAVVILGAAVIFFTLRPSPPATVASAEVSAPAAGPELVADAPAAENDKVFGVMPNPARWFSPAPKPDHPPAEPQPPARRDTSTSKAPAAAIQTQALPPVPAVTTPVAAAVTPAAVAPVPVAKPSESAPAVVPPPPVQVAVASPAKAEPDRRPLYREQPAFPVEAARAGVESGLVKARMVVNESGAVTRVEILESRPRRVFDRAVTAALSKWKFREAGSSFTVETLIEFKES
ncbi:energy transducer TonB [Chitinimonas sp. BJYL2]|uniref:energy transducer TonB n=1 Tax=Chitinimonas sp. BJYL2 TaxID=2976696 RepID=UPI0022B527C5|nr:energy transducer TonB [Chitinimonas sp. BJYL2]